MANYKITNTEKIKYWKEVIIGFLLSKNTQQASPQEFLEKYPHAELPILQIALTELIAEGKVQQI